MSVELTFMESGKKLLLCELDLRDGNFVTVEPYAIYSSAKKRRCFMWYQTGRAGAVGDIGWRHVETGNIRGAKVLDKPYTIRKDYNPFDAATLVMVHYAQPDAEGKERPVELAPTWDKSVHNRPAGT